MRNLMRSGAITVAAALVGSTALLSAPAVAASGPLKVAQAEPRERGDRGGDREGRGGGEMRSAPQGGEMRGGGEMRSGEPRMERSPQLEQRMERPRVEQRLERPRGEQRLERPRGEPRMERAPRVEQRFDRPRVEQRMDRHFDERRYEQRGDLRYQTLRRHRPEFRYRYPFVDLGGPRIIVREYGPGWCRGLHRGYHWAPRIGWHYGTHRGLYRCW